MRRNNNKMPSGGGPLMTDHLHDLELELELLKRKRQLIQRQQSQMLYNRGPADNMRFDQPSQSFNDRFNEPQHLNFSHLYNEAPRDGSFGLKRRAEPDWSGAPVDRFNGPVGGNKRPRQGPFDRFMDQNNSQNFQRPRPKPQPLLNMPKPLMNFPPQGARRPPQPNNSGKQNQGPKPLTHHPNFKRNKQTGSNFRPGFKPNKTNASPKKTGPVTANESPKDKKAPILSADTPPSNKTNGRLELALGLIVKEIKVVYSKNPECAGIFDSMPLARLMKQGIRERLRGVMTGKPVGVVPDIVAEYRSKFPPETDKDIVDLAVVEKLKIDQKSELAITLLEAGDPEEYFKKNMGKLLEVRLDEMLKKLEKVYNDEKMAPLITEILENLPEVKKTLEEKVTATEGTPENAATEETPEKSATEATPDKSATEATPDKSATEATPDKSATEATPEKAATEGTPEKAATEGTPEKTADETPTAIQTKGKNYDKWMSLLLQRRLPSLLKRQKPAILKLFDLDHMFRNTKAAIIINAGNKAQALKQNSGEGKDDPEMPRNLPYFAKVLAIPTMPKRKMMQDFLNQFKPKTIKRHKKNFNLLFVGLDSKENYEKLLAANQTPIGNTTLSITGNVMKPTTIEIDDQNDIDQVLTPQLDDQINDLLSSIRKADEDAKDTGNAKNETADNIDLTSDSIDQDDDNVEEVKPDGNENLEETNDNKKTEAANAENDAEKSKYASDAAKPGADNEEQADDECQVVETNGKDVVTIEDDEVAPLKSDEGKQVGKTQATPAKGRAPAPATPSSVRTRRSSRLVQN